MRNRREDLLKLAEKQAVSLTKTLKLLGSPFEVLVLYTSDKSDPLNQHVLVGTRVRSPYPPLVPKSA